MPLHRPASSGRLTWLLACLATLAAVTMWAGAVVKGQGSQGAEPSIVVGFDAVEDFVTKGTDIEGFRVGYFRQGSNIPIRTVDVPRTAVSISGGVMRLAAPRLAVESPGIVVLRLQTLSKSRGGSSWSAPTSPITLPIAPAAVARPSTPPRERNPAPERRRPAALSRKDVQAHPSLEAEFATRLGSGSSVDDALKAFRRVEDAATAAIVSRLHDIPLRDMCSLMIGPPALSLRQAIRRLKPSVDPREVIRAARIEGRRLLSPSMPARRGRPI